MNDSTHSLNDLATHKAIEMVRAELREEWARARKSTTKHARIFAGIAVAIFAILAITSRGALLLLSFYAGFVVILGYGTWRQFRTKSDFLFENWLEILEKTPETASDFHERAELLHSYGQENAAMADFRTAKELNPENENYCLRYIHVLLEMTQENAALAEIEVQLAKGDHWPPKTRAELFLLRAILLKDRDVALAKASFDSAVDCSPEEPCYYLERANFLLAQDHFAEAKFDLAGSDLDKAEELLKAGKWNFPDDYHQLRAKVNRELADKKTRD